MPTVAVNSLAVKLKGETGTPFGTFPANTVLFNLSRSLYNTLWQTGYADRLLEGVSFGFPSYDVDKAIYIDASGNTATPPGGQPGGGGGNPNPTPGGSAIIPVTQSQYNSLLASSSLQALAFYLVAGAKLLFATTAAAALTIADGTGGSTPTPTPTPGAAFSMAQLPAANRIYQRKTVTGGTNAKGTGDIVVPATVTASGTVTARCRDVTSNSIVQPAWNAGTATAGQTSITVTGVAARSGWFYLDLSQDGGTTWQPGTVPIGMGRLVAMSGQSQTVRQFAKMPTYSGTNASLNVSISPLTAVYARYADSGKTLTTPAWAVPADGSNYDSTFVSEFLRRQVDLFGVNCGAIGHAVGSTKIADWLPGTQNHTDLSGVLNAAGGFEAFYMHIGGTDAGVPTAAADFATGFTTFFSSLTALNGARGSSFARYVTAMATRLATGTEVNVRNLRSALKAWAAGTGAAMYLEPRDVTLADDVHQDPAGNIRLAQHLYRATRSEASLAADAGPTLASAVRATGSADILLTFNLPTGATSLSMVGAGQLRFVVSVANDTTPLALDATTPIVVGTNTITLKLAAVPANTVALDIWVLKHPDPSGTTAASAMIYDNHTNGDGIAVGRHLTPSYLPTVAAAPGGGSTPTPTPTPSAPFVDDFTDTDGVSLAAHVSATGHTWTVPAGTLTISGANGTVIGAASSNGLSSYIAPSADAYVEGVIVEPVGTPKGNSLWLLLGVNGGNNWYQFGLQRPGTTAQHGWYIGKTVGGTFTALTGAFAAQLFTPGETWKLRGERQGNVLRLFANDVKVIEITDTTFSVAGGVGVRNSGVASLVDGGTQFTSMKAGVL